MPYPKTFEDDDLADPLVTGDVVPVMTGTSGSRVNRRVELHAYRARVYRSGAQSISDATDTAIQFVTVAFDSDSMVNLVAYSTRITIQKTGYYRAGGLVRFAANTGGYRRAYIMKNAATVEAEIVSGTLAASFAWGGNLFVENYYTSGDYLELYAYQNRGGALNTASWCWLSAALVGFPLV